MHLVDIQEPNPTPWEFVNNGEDKQGILWLVKKERKESADSFYARLDEALEKVGEPRCKPKQAHPTEYLTKEMLNLTLGGSHRDLVFQSTSEKEAENKKKGKVLLPLRKKKGNPSPNRGRDLNQNRRDRPTHKEEKNSQCEGSFAPTKRLDFYTKGLRQLVCSGQKPFILFRWF
ncbi:hypothetical protein AJ79_10133 [Helicocarpus griseus UAMH5409]|uniref:Uncharacterized protein n=1 Tax=Helicocarpus griseus UAMH5409 TaxID=1447875 RepID=A0A2B7WFA3_9EURO|nr:hypothetical protein AJ79_10133 [Helicocarpus griseus UAMH5409]